MPTGYDRLLATRFGGAAVRAVADGRWGHMVALQPPYIDTIPIQEALHEPKRVDLNGDVVRTAREIGIFVWRLKTEAERFLTLSVWGPQVHMFGLLDFAAIGARP
jgi:6-phosphofructokinase